MKRKITIAIDGFSSCGKSTMAKELARELGYIYVDTGAMYRGVALVASRRGLASEVTHDEAGIASMLQEIELNFKLGDDGLPQLYLGQELIEPLIRTIEIGAIASRVAALPAVREAMTRQQQRLGEAGGVVMDGRDIGTVVFPNAELKIFVTADPKIRAERRLLELEAKGETGLTLESVQRSIEERDYNDMHRPIAPLKQAEDAIVLDNSHLSRSEQSARLRELATETIQKLEAHE